MDPVDAEELTFMTPDARPDGAPVVMTSSLRPDATPVIGEYHFSRTPLNQFNDPETLRKRKERLLALVTTTTTEK